MEKWQVKRGWDEFRREESNDVSELEAQAYSLFQRSTALTDLMSSYPKLPRGTAREHIMDTTTDRYVESFSGYVQAIARDTHMSEPERWTALKLTILNEEQRRMAPINGIPAGAKMVFEDLDMEFADDLVDGLDTRPAIDKEAHDKLMIIFNDMTRNDIDLFKKVFNL